MAAAVVGGAFLSAALQVLFDRLASREVLSFIRGNEIDVALFDKLQLRLLSINLMLNDAEAKHTTSSLVKAWVDKLKALLCDAEDVLDEIATEQLQCEIKGSSVSTLDSQSINSKVEKILGRMDDIVQSGNALRLRECSVDVNLGRQRRPSSGVAQDCKVFGRDEIKEKMVQVLLSNVTSSQNVDVLSIVGMGGSGKTTLAKLLFNDLRIKDAFDITAWVCVSQVFDIQRIISTILEQLNPSFSTSNTNLHSLLVNLNESINGKKFLLVMDDVWINDFIGWHNFLSDIKFGATAGSKLIVTTRSTRVAETVKSIHTHHLQELSVEDGWAMLQDLVFKKGMQHQGSDPQLQVIGREIVRKCGGLPLAIVAMGGLLCPTMEVEKWDKVLNSKFWDLPNTEEIPALRLSYSYLSSHLKRCFSYCAIFPKQYTFEKEKLVMLWMAEGLLTEKIEEETRVLQRAHPSLI